MEPILFTNPHEAFNPLGKGPRNRRERRQALKNPRLFNNRKRTKARLRTKVQFIPAKTIIRMNASMNRSGQPETVHHEARYIQH